jgi:hypothetical protein
VLLPIPQGSPSATPWDDLNVVKRCVRWQNLGFQVCEAIGELPWGELSCVVADYQANNGVVRSIAEVISDGLPTGRYCVVEPLHVSGAVVAHRHSVTPDLFTGEKTDIQLDGLSLATSGRIVKGVPVVIMISALAIIVLLQDRQVPFAAGHDWTQPLNVFR